MSVDVDRSVLETIGSPRDLRALPRERVEEVANALRAEIVERVSRTGGHLASSLGALELITAIHYVFDTPDDKLVLDVGHQGYAHKMLTGRRTGFDRIGKDDGIGKFLRRSESEYDAFGAGHAGTSISACLGMARAFQHQDKENCAIALIGDGGMTAGMAFEALNHAGHLQQKNLVVVLNDNEMSISPNVGAMSSYLSRKLAAPMVRRMKGWAKEFLGTMPGDMLHWAQKAEESLKVFFSPGLLFEALNFKYVGPIQGHRMDVVLETFENVREMVRNGDGPILVHALTDGTSLDMFQREFPSRFYDVGIAEQHAVTFAAGLAAEGMKPVAAIYSTFLQRAYDQVVHDVCVQNLDVTFAMDRAGLVGADGATHQGQYDIAFLRTLPNIVVMAPKDENELRHMLKTAVSYDGPAAIRYPRGAGYGVPLDPDVKAVPVGEAELLRDGDDAVIVAYGTRVHESLAAAEELAADGLAVAVLNARFAKPLDEARILGLARRCRALVTVEEHAGMGGFGSAVLELLAREGAAPAVRCLAIPDQLVEQGDPEEQLADFGMDTPGIAQAVRDLLGSSPG
jgi:1-deoxy-D-xylulose-5-phosphate synthase